MPAKPAAHPAHRRAVPQGHPEGPGVSPLGKNQGPKKRGGLNPHTRIPPTTRQVVWQGRGGRGRATPQIHQLGAPGKKPTARSKGLPKNRERVGGNTPRRYKDRGQAQLSKTTPRPKPASQTKQTAHGPRTESSKYRNCQCTVLTPRRCPQETQAES